MANKEVFCISYTIFLDVYDIVSFLLLIEAVVDKYSNIHVFISLGKKSLDDKKGIWIGKTGPML